jgi:hypothetical protein
MNRDIYRAILDKLVFSHSFPYGFDFILIKLSRM